MGLEQMPVSSNQPDENLEKVVAGFGIEGKDEFSTGEEIYLENPEKPDQLDEWIVVRRPHDTDDMVHIARTRDGKEDKIPSAKLRKIYYPNSVVKSSDQERNFGPVTNEDLKQSGLKPGDLGKLMN